MSYTSTFLWTAAALVAATWISLELSKRPSRGGSVEEIGESNEVHELEEEERERQLIAERNAQAVDARDSGENGAGERDAGAEWDNDDRARRALEEHQARQAQDNQRVNAWKQKGTVGTKKARSLERRDRRRAYFEYVRQEAERERQILQAEEDMFGDLLAEEREERERRIEQAKRELDERNRARREKEEEERAQRRQRRQDLEQAIRSQGFVQLKDDADVELADELSNVVVLENCEYAVSLTTNVIETLTNTLKDRGKLSFTEIQELLPSLYKV